MISDSEASRCGKTLAAVLMTANADSTIGFSHPLQYNHALTVNVFVSSQDRSYNCQTDVVSYLLVHVVYYYVQRLYIEGRKNICIMAASYFCLEVLQLCYLWESMTRCLCAAK